MYSIFYRLYAYARHSLRAVISKRGYGIHSPFAFEFVTTVIHPKSVKIAPCFQKIETQRAQLKRDTSTVQLDNGKMSTVKQVAKTSASPKSDGRLFFRIATYMQSHTIVELGTSLGLGTSYLASASSESKVISLDHNPQIQNLAQHTLDALQLSNVSLISGAFENTLATALGAFEKLDLGFFDGHHQGEATLHYYELAKAKCHDKSIFVFHDIHWSKDMYQAWQTICADLANTLTIECHNIGMVFFRSDLEKLHYLA